MAGAAMRQPGRPAGIRSISNPPHNTPAAPMTPRIGPMVPAISLTVMPWMRVKKVGVQAPAAQTFAPISVTPMNSQK